MSVRQLRILLAMALLAVGYEAWPMRAMAEPPSQVETMEGVAAIVNDQVISFSDVRNRARLIALSLNLEADTQNLAEASVYALRALIDEHLQMQEAQNFEIDVTDTQLDQHLDGLAQRNGVTLAEFLETLSSRNINPVTLRQQIRAQSVWQQLISGLYGQRVRISNVQIDRVLERLSRSLQQEQFHVAEILLDIDTPDQRQEVLSRAQALRQQIAGSGASFNLVAQQFSAAPSAPSGGDLGWVSRDALRPELAQIVETMNESDLSEPIETDDGVYLIALINRRAPASEQGAVLHLGQIASFESDAVAKVMAARQSYIDCAALAQASGSVQDGLIISDLGNLEADSLSEAVRKAVEHTQTGHWSEAISLRGNGVATMLVCNRMSSQESALPDRKIVEGRLFEDHLTRLSSRYLRDLRREATIVRPKNSADNDPSIISPS